MFLFPRSGKRFSELGNTKKKEKTYYWSALSSFTHSFHFFLAPCQRIFKCSHHMTKIIREMSPTSDGAIRTCQFPRDLKYFISLVTIATPNVHIPCFCPLAHVSKCCKVNELHKKVLHTEFHKFVTKNRLHPREHIYFFIFSSNFT